MTSRVAVLDMRRRDGSVRPQTRRTKGPVVGMFMDSPENLSSPAPVLVNLETHGVLVLPVSK